jgi:transcriptional regulator with XRE-family HTH domain
LTVARQARASKDNTQMAEMVRSFGEEVRRLMAARGVGLRELARRVNYDPGYLSKVVNGRKAVSGDLARRVDAALDAGGVLAAFVAVPGLNGSFTSDDEERLILAARHPRRIDRGVVASLAGVLAAQRRLEDQVGSASMLKAVTAQLAVVGNLAGEARAPLRGDVLGVAGQYAQFAGWLNANTRRLADAGGWYDRALEWAAESGDVNMTATALNMKGYLAWLDGKVGPMIGLSQAAQRGQGISAGVRALAVQQEARGHALAGDGDDADRKLDEAASLVESAAGHAEDEPPWIYFYSADYLALQRGLAYLFLGRYAQAIELLSDGLAEMPPEVRQSEWIAWYLVRLAAAYAHAGDAEQACSVALQAVLVASQTGSSRLRAQLCRLRAQLAARWPGLAVVAELGERLR